VDEQFITVGSKRIEISNLPGKKNDTGFVLLHEGLGCVELWGEFPSRLSQAFGSTVFSYSRFGYGRSDEVALPRSLDYHSEEATEYLPKVLDNASLESCILVGHSDGASIALIYAALFSDSRVKGLVLLAPHVKAEEKTVEQIRQLVDSCNSSDLLGKLRKYHRDNTECALYGWSRCWLDPKFSSWTIEHLLPNVGIPVLTVRGLDDPYNSDYHVQSIRNKVRSLVHTASIVSCAHSPHRESTQSLISTIKMFRSAIEV